MTNQPENPLVFPIRDANDHPGPLGLTLRDYFAGQALSGFMTNSSIPLVANRAQYAYAAADAMLAERERTK